ncbi:MAG: radical SAM protein [bacterium]
MLKLAEVFKGFQGEGPTTGSSALFIRMLGCNLSCYLCDSKFSWKQNKLSYIEISQQDLFEQISNCNRIVITGGEPLIYSNDQLVKSIVQNFGAIKPIEIETNGTIVPSKTILDLFKKYSIQLNISPKINIQQENDEDTFPHIIKHLKNQNYIVKFLATNKKDFQLIDQLVDQFHIPCSKVWIQPIGIKSNQVKQTCLNLEQDILQRNFNLSARLHVLLFEDQRGK